MLVLPDEHRKLFKEPFGILYHDIDNIIPFIRDQTIYSVGDVVTHNLQKKGITPAVAVVDGRTMRLPCSRMPALTGVCINVKNSAGTLTDELIRGLGDAVVHPPATVIVDGEEDLAVIPLVLAAPVGTIILYGQPHEGVVLRTVDQEAKTKAQTLLNLFIYVDA